MTRITVLAVVLLSLLPALSIAADPGPVVNESARQIPVAYDVDVLVVGGSTGAVAAAVAAADEGAKVFLATPHSYLGDDMTATLRLWLEPGEKPQSPLARRIFNDTGAAGGSRSPNALTFTYETDRPSEAVHKDTSPPSLLADGLWGDASKQSVQYGGDVSVVADLGKPQEIKEARLVFYRRASGQGGTNFDVAAATLSTSDDKKAWTQVAEAKNEQSGESRELTLPVGREARYVKLSVRKPDDVPRMLLGEIEIIAAKPQAPPEPATTAVPPPRPMHVKRVLDQALLDAGVQFLYGCYPTDVLRDAGGKPCGIVMANRAGRQAVIAKTIIDATGRAVVARMAGAKFRPYPAGEQTFGFVVIGGQKHEVPGATVREIAPPFQGKVPNPVGSPDGVFRIWDYALKIPMKGTSDASWAAAEQTARTATYDPLEQFTSDDLFQVPPDPMVGAKEGKLGAFRPADVERLWVLGGCADVDREDAARLLRPLALVDAGTEVGKAAGAEAKAAAAPQEVKLAGPKPSDRPAAPGDVAESLGGVRPTQESPTIPQDARAVPVLGTYDVVVIGGGTSGAPAGIGAARQGAKTLVIEYQHILGGVGTVGAISGYYSGNRVGFTSQISPGTRPNSNSWIIEQKAEWWRSELLKAGGDLWFGAIGCGAFRDGDRVAGVVVATPRGRGVVLAGSVIDATGNSDIAAAAGAECMYTGRDELAMQGTGLPPRNLGATYANTDFTIADETDIVDIWHLFVYSKDKFPGAFDQGTFVDTRERRCIVGDLVMNVLDQMNGRTYPDTVCQARGGPFDTHGYTVDPYLFVVHPADTQRLIVNIPYRCILPKSLDGLLVVGLGLSVHRDAIPLVRMQPDLQNLGYAAGVAAATAAKDRLPLRKLDLKALQKHLVEIGNVKEEVLTAVDSYPLSDEKIAAAVDGFGADRKHAAVLFAFPEKSLPLLRKAYAGATSVDKPEYAFVLAMLGDPSGVDALIDKVRGRKEWDAGWNYRGMGQFGNAMSELDSQIVALGRSRQAKAVPAILEKLGQLSAESAFSHHRAVALGLEAIGDKSAAKPLAELLAKPGMSGHVHTNIEVAYQRGVPGGTNAEQTRRESLRELFLARALYHCGDCDGVGEKILKAYTQDLRGHLARHAKAVLEAGK